MISKMINSKSVKGFTLIELLIGVSVSIIGALAGYTLIISMNQAVAGSSEVVRTQQEARVVLEQITRELRESNPNKVWPSSLTYNGSDYIAFLTPRNDDREFIVGSDGKPKWQRAIIYRYDRYSKELLREQVYISSSTGYPLLNTYYTEVMAENVEKLYFSRSNDMIVISLRMLGDAERTQNTSDLYTDLNTRVKLRN